MFFTCDVVIWIKIWELLRKYLLFSSVVSHTPCWCLWEHSGLWCFVKELFCWSSSLTVENRMPKRAHYSFCDHLIIILVFPLLVNIHIFSLSFPQSNILGFFFLTTGFIFRTINLKCFFCKSQYVCSWIVLCFMYT